MIIVDNSESSRNGDYTPTRFEAQVDAVTLIFSTKTNANPESTVGLMSMGGSGPVVLTTPTTDFGKVLDGLHRTKIAGEAHLASGIAVARLALKHRSNSSQRQRIIVFSCSPVDDQQEGLVRLAKSLKKEKVSVDIVCFGELEEAHTAKLVAFQEAVDGDEGSNIAILPPGSGLLRDSLRMSQMLVADLGGSNSDGVEGGAGSAEDQFEFGVDPNMDPELALVLRMSFEEERQRLEKEAKERRDREAREASQLEGIEEEGESSSLLQSAAQPESGDSTAPAKSSGGESHDKKPEDDPDRMDTA